MTEYLTALRADMTPERIAAIGGVLAGLAVAAMGVVRVGYWSWLAACWCLRGRKPDAALAAMLETISNGTGATVQGDSVLVIGPLRVFTEATRSSSNPSGLLIHVSGADKTDLYAPHELRAIRKAAERRIAAYKAAEREAGRQLATEALCNGRKA
jgi:hypothetical protein